MRDKRFRKEVAEKLLLGMEAKGLSKTTLAKRLGISRQALYNYLYEKNTPNSEVIALICRELEVDIKYRDMVLSAGDFSPTRSRPKAVPKQLRLKEISPEQVHVRVGKRSDRSVEFILELRIA